MTKAYENESARTPPTSGVWASFSNRRYRAVVIGRFITTLAVWFLLLTLSLSALEVTGGSGFALGATAAVQGVPILILGLLSGSIIDRLTAHRTSIILTLFGLTGSLMITAVTLRFGLSYPVVLTIAACLGLFQAFDRPTAQVLLRDSLPEHLRASGQSLLTVFVSSARFLGPTAAGLAYSWGGPILCFVVGAVLFAAATLIFVFLPGGRNPREDPRGLQHRQAVLPELREGMAFAWAHREVRSILAANAVTGLLAFNFTTLITSMIKIQLDGEALHVGIAEGLDAAGAILGGLLVGRLIGTSTRSFRISVSVLGLAMLLNGLAPSLPVYLALAPLFGLALASYEVTMYGSLQRIVPAGMTARVMSLANLGTVGTTPIGAIACGIVIQFAGPGWAYGMAAASCLVAALLVRPSHTPRPVPDTVA